MIILRGIIVLVLGLDALMRLSGKDPLEIFRLASYLLQDRFEVDVLDRMIPAYLFPGILYLFDVRRYFHSLINHPCQ